MTTPLGKYRLVKLIASGGMAEVYLARQAGAAGFEKMVCLKRILPHLARDRQFVEMFLEEARLAARLDHPNIVSILDLGEASGSYFIAMEFIDGPSLRAIGKRAADLGELLPLRELTKCISMAAAGLDYAHNLAGDDGRPLGLVHRDVSPDNILVHKNGVAKVVDFGIAKAANSSTATRSGTLKGKVAYMPPEQLRGEPLDRRTDVFALGVCFYELLAGKRPLEGSSDVALMGKIMTDEPQPLGALRADLPPVLIAIVERMLAKDRDARYQSCAEVHSELEAFLGQAGSAVTPARMATFVKKYAPEPPARTDETDAHVRQVEAELSGTARLPAPADGTVVLGQPVARRGARPFLVAVASFLAVVLLGGGAGYWYLYGQKRDDAQPVQIEHASVVETPKPQPPPAAPPVAPVVVAKEEPKPEPAKVAGEPPKAEPAKTVEPPKAEPAKAVEEPKPKQRVAKKVAAAEPAQPAVVIVKEQPVEPPPPVVVAKGELVLLIRPWAKVEVDGREVGVTPLDPIALAPGDHEVRLVNPDLGKDVTRTVHISPSGREVLKEILDQ